MPALRRVTVVAVAAALLSGVTGPVAKAAAPGTVERSVRPKASGPKGATFGVTRFRRERVVSARIEGVRLDRPISTTRVLDAALTGRRLRVALPRRAAKAPSRLRLKLVVSTVPPLWSSDTERGSLDDWYLPRSGGGTSGGEFNSGGGISKASGARAHSGRRSAELTLPSGSGGVRLFRWAELRTNRDVTTSVWMYFPHRFTPRVRWWNVMQLMSRTAGNDVTPIWHLDVANTATGAMRLDLVWWQRSLPGPRSGQAGYRRLRPAVPLPAGRWVNLRARFRQSKDFDGAVQIWQDDRLLFDERNVRTAFPNCAFNAWCTANEWSVNNYSAGVSPAPTVIYADDARIDANAQGPAAPVLPAPGPSPAPPKPLCPPIC